MYNKSFLVFFVFFFLLCSSSLLSYTPYFFTGVTPFPNGNMVRFVWGWSVFLPCYNILFSLNWLMSSGYQTFVWWGRLGVFGGLFWSSLSASAYQMVLKWMQNAGKHSIRCSEVYARGRIRYVRSSVLVILRVLHAIRVGETRLREDWSE